MSKLSLPQGFLVSIVDDDLSVCEGLQDLLNSLGLVAQAFQRADAFLQSDERGRTACLIADVQMPGMSGLELHDHLVKSGRAVPTILITAFPKSADRLHARRNGVRCYLTKPFSEQDLIACIQAALAPPEGRTSGERPD
jgi:FixJ family two-component response regulator